MKRSERIARYASTVSVVDVSTIDDTPCGARCPEGTPAYSSVDFCLSYARSDELNQSPEELKIPDSTSETN